MSWRLAKSLTTLRSQVDAAYPKRSKASDGNVSKSLARWYNGDMTHCSIDECENDKKSKGMCKPHYDAWYRTGNPLSYRGDRSSLSLWEKIQEIGYTVDSDGCHIYNGYKNSNGYGQFRDKDSNKLTRTHREAYKQLVGDLDSTKVILHLCDNPPCMNVDHLYQGTQAENIKDMWSKGRAAKSDLKVCKNDHEYPDDRPRGINKNRCRECAKERNRKYHARKRGLVYGN